MLIKERGWNRDVDNSRSVKSDDEYTAIIGRDGVDARIQKMIGGKEGSESRIREKGRRLERC